MIEGKALYIGFRTREVGRLVCSVRCQEIWHALITITATQSSCRGREDPWPWMTCTGRSETNHCLQELSISGLGVVDGEPTDIAAAGGVSGEILLRPPRLWPQERTYVNIYRSSIAESIKY